MKLYTAKKIAVILDVSERRVRQLRDECVIKPHGDSNLYELLPATHAYINYLRKRNPDSPDGPQKLDYNTERALFARTKRIEAEFDLQIKEKDLHSTQDIETVFTSMLVNFKTRLLALPAKLAPILSKKESKEDIFKIIKANIDEVLVELSEFDSVLLEVNRDEASNS